jgi:uncharacterized membrane protein YhaH (DUF805 family)
LVEYLHDKNLVDFAGKVTRLNNWWMITIK